MSIGSGIAPPNLSIARPVCIGYQHLVNQPLDADERYRAVVGPDHELLTKELKLLNLLADEVEARLPAGLSEAERVTRAQEVVSADPVLTAMATELVALADAREEPALWQQADEAEAKTSDDL